MTVELEQTDQEQVEALQRWWRENWLSLLGGLALGLAGIVGWQYYGESRLEKAEAASVAYEDVKTKLAMKRLDEAKAAIATLESEHAGSPYVLQSRLNLAAVQADTGDWAGAEQTLRNAAAAKPDAALAGLIRLRLGRALWAQGKTAEALAELDDASGAYAALAQELRGDIAAATGDTSLARKAYQAALASNADYLDGADVQRKLDALN